jgi:hypothetical protein
MAAASCGRKPADKNDKSDSREAAKRRQQSRLLPPLRGSNFDLIPIRGLTPTAMCCRRFAAKIASHVSDCDSSPNVHSAF